jgi:Domain of Unknown Function (DUF1080).
MLTPGYVFVSIQQTYDNAPGYQVDMGKGYWGSLWEERRASMVQKYPDAMVKKLVHQNGWNHYYIIAKGHHIQAWLNGVKTIDIIHDAGFLEGNIGFQLCHYHSHTAVDVNFIYPGVVAKLAALLKQHYLFNMNWKK